MGINYAGVLISFFIECPYPYFGRGCRETCNCQLSECNSLTVCVPRGIRTFDSVIAYLPDENTSIIMTDISILCMMSISCNFALIRRAEHALKVVEVLFHVQDVIMFSAVLMYTAYD